MPSNPIDDHVGARVRGRRAELKITQQDLAENLGVTFQQVQKYERGLNRISASKLFRIAKILEVDVGFFFSGLDVRSPVADADSPGTTPTFDWDEIDPLLAFAGSDEGLELNRAFSKIRSAATRRHVVALIASIADDLDRKSASVPPPVKGIEDEYAG